MAKDISLLGADYPDVPAVTLPKTGGGTATFIEESELGNTHVWVGTSDTAAATREKAVTIAGVTEYKTGDVFVITFTYAQDYNGSPRLNVNSLGYKTIRRLVGTSATRYQWQAGETLIMVYDGTYMVAVNQGLATTTYYGLTRLNASCTNTSSGVALTSSALNIYSERMIAGVPVYSAESTYEVGDKVRYSWYIYECNTAITEAEAWNAEHWTQLPALQTQIDALGSNIGTLSSLATSTKTSAVAAINEVNQKALFPYSSNGRGQAVKMFTDSGSNFFILRLDQNDAGTNYMQAVFFGNTKQIQIIKCVNGTETVMATFTGT